MSMKKSVVANTAMKQKQTKLGHYEKSDNSGKKI